MVADAPGTWRICACRADCSDATAFTEEVDEVVIGGPDGSLAVFGRAGESAPHAYIPGPALAELGLVAASDPPGPAHCRSGRPAGIVQATGSIVLPAGGRFAVCWRASWSADAWVFAGQAEAEGPRPGVDVALLAGVAEVVHVEGTGLRAADVVRVSQRECETGSALPAPDVVFPQRDEGARPPGAAQKKMKRQKKSFAFISLLTPLVF